MSEERVLLAHGDGGELMGELIERVFVARLGTGEPAGDDSARIVVGQEQAPFGRAQGRPTEQSGGAQRPRPTEG